MRAAGFLSKPGQRYKKRAGRHSPLVAQVQERRKRQQVSATELSFREYIAIVNPLFQFYRWTEILIARLQEVADGKLHRLLVQVPPRHGKTELCKLFAGYYLLRHQRRFVGVTSYSMDLAAGFSRAARSYYGEAGGTFNPAAKAVEFWETASNGGCWAAGTGGSVTGKGAHLAILDDPVKGREEAESPAYIRKLHDWYKSTLRTRINPEDGAIVIVQTRWSAVDAIGLCLDLEEQADPEDREGWHIIDFPALYEPWELRPDIPECVTVEEDFRTVLGQALCPERYNERALRRIRASIGSREFGSLFQQNPQAIDGAIFRPSWWNYRPMLGPKGSRPPWRRVILSVDCAFEDTAKSDFVAIAVLGQRTDGTFDVIDLINERLDVIRTMQAIRKQVTKWRPSAVLVEKAANGHAVIQMMKKSVPNMVAIKPSEGGSKTSRAQAAAPMIEAGSVFLPTEAHWLPFLLNQFALFPVGKNDDAVDAITQGLNWLRQRPSPRKTATTWGRGTRPAVRRQQAAAA